MEHKDKLYLTYLGFEIAHTGGGCTALVDSEWHYQITSKEHECIAPDNFTNEVIFVGVWDGEGDSPVLEYPSLRSFLKAYSDYREKGGKDSFKTFMNRPDTDAETPLLLTPEEMEVIDNVLGLDEMDNEKDDAERINNVIANILKKIASNESEKNVIIPDENKFVYVVEAFKGRSTIGVYDSIETIKKAFDDMILYQDGYDEWKIFSTDDYDEHMSDDDMLDTFEDAEPEYIISEHQLIKY